MTCEPQSASQWRAACALMLVAFTSTVGLSDDLSTGDRAPDFTATGVDGKPFKLSSLQGKDGKKVVLIFSRAHW